MAVSEWDRDKMARLARDLAAAETDEEPSPRRRAEIIAWANEYRLRAGMPPLADEWADPPEEEFYRRARPRNGWRPSPRYLTWRWAAQSRGPCPVEDVIIHKLIA